MAEEEKMSTALAIDESVGGVVPHASAVAGVVPLASPAPSQLGALKAQRADIQTQIAKLQAAREMLGPADTRLAALEAERRQLDDDQAARLLDWARGGCCGAQPVQDEARTTDLGQRLEAAERGAQAAAGAIRELDHQLAELHANAAGIQHQIESVALDEMAAEFEAYRQEIALTVDALNTKLAYLNGIHRFLTTNPTPERLRLAEALRPRTKFRIGFTPDELDGAAREWGVWFAMETA